MNAVTLSVVVPTYNCAELLRECLQSIENQSRKPDAVIIIDDGSTEDIQAAVDAFSGVNLIRRDINGGFCKAINTGIQAAHTTLVLLLNNDMTLDPRCIELMMNAAVANPETLLTPLVLFKDQPDIVYSAGDVVRVNGRPESIGFRMRRDELSIQNAITGVTGGAALIPRKVFDHVGLFDEQFVAYFEDADFCLRARAAGYQAALVPDAIAYHVGSASLGGKTWWRSRQCFRNHALLVTKHFPARFFLRHAAPILLESAHQAWMTLSSARAEFGLFRALLLLIGTKREIAMLVPHALRERKRINRLRTTPIDQIIR